MRERRPSEEELRQREREERSRQEFQEQAYREAQRGVYSRIYKEQNSLPEDYREAFDLPPEAWDEFPPDRPPRSRKEDTVRWDSGPGSAPRPARPDRGRRKPPDPPRPKPRGQRPPPPKKKKKKVPRRNKILAVVIAVLAALAVLAILAHAMLIRPPEQPPVEEDPGVAPHILEAGRKADVFTFLLVGRDDGGGGNTDTIMVGCFDAKNGTMDVLSIFRDTMVDVPWDVKKINSVYNRQGLEGLEEQIKNLLGYVPDYHFIVELDAVRELVDAVGGVTYDVPFNMDYDDPSQDLHIHFKKGEQKLSGDEAMKLLRWRKNNSGEALSVGDIGRVEIQHSFLRAMAKQMLNISNVPRLQKIARVVDENLTSNLSYGEMIWFGERALGMEKDAIRFHTLPGDYNGTMWSTTYQNNQSYVFVNDQMLLDLVNTYMNPYLADITPDMQHVIHGTTVNSAPVLPEIQGTAGEGTQN